MSAIKERLQTVKEEIERLIEENGEWFVRMALEEISKEEKIELKED